MYKTNYNAWILEENLIKIYNNAISKRYTDNIYEYKDLSRQYRRLKLSTDQSLTHVPVAYCFGSSLLWGLYYINCKLNSFYFIMDVITSKTVATLSDKFMGTLNTNLPPELHEIAMFCTSLLHVQSVNINLKNNNLTKVNKQIHIPNMYKFSEYSDIEVMNSPETLRLFFQKFKEADVPSFAILCSDVHTISCILEGDHIIIFDINRQYSRLCSTDNNEGVIKVCIKDSYSGLYSLLKNILLVALNKEIYAHMIYKEPMQTITPNRHPYYFKYELFTRNNDINQFLLEEQRFCIGRSNMLSYLFNTIKLTKRTHVNSFKVHDVHLNKVADILKKDIKLLPEYVNCPIAAIIQYCMTPNLVERTYPHMINNYADGIYNSQHDDIKSLNSKRNKIQNALVIK